MCVWHRNQFLQGSDPVCCPKYPHLEDSSCHGFLRVFSVLTGLHDGIGVVFRGAKPGQRLRIDFISMGVLSGV